MAMPGRTRVSLAALVEPFVIKAAVFVSGSVLMSLEMAGSRVLAPYYGSTIFVWASLISVFLVALAFGYYAGGFLADKKPSFLLWASLLAAAGILTILIPFICGPANRLLLALPVPESLAVLIASVSIFFLPSLVLGMISPFAIKFITKNISLIGKASGKIYAWSALGNVLGTLFTAFFLIGRFGVFSIFMGLGITLLVVSGFIFLFRLRLPAAGGLLCVCSPFLLLLPLPRLVEIFPGEKAVFQKDSFYNHIVVSDNASEGSRRLRFDRFVEQAGIYLAPPYGSIHDTVSLFHLGAAFCPEMQKALFIGCGGGIAPRNYFSDYQPLKVDVVEIDPLVAQVSRDYFFFFEAPGLKINIDDGRRFVQKTGNSYDVAVLDVFNSAGQIPFHLLTREFFAELNSRLSDKGVVCLNLISPMQGRGGVLFNCVYKTLADVFGQVYIFPNMLSGKVMDRNKPMNIIILATKEKKRLSRDEIYTLIYKQELSGRLKVCGLAKAALFCYEPEPLREETGFILTDDFAPVDILYARYRF